MAHAEPRSPRFRTADDVLECVKSGPFLWVTNGAGNEVLGPVPVNSRLF